MSIATPSLSVIVPVLHDTIALAGLLACLAEQTRPPEEIIVADGGDDSGCAALCRDHGVRYLATRPGRGGQLRAGAELAGHEALWFLHADTLPDPEAAAALRASLADGAVGGCFAFRFAGPQSPGRRWLAALINWRAGIGMPYGDQGIYASASAYRDAGGFADEPLFEEVPLVRGLRQLGRFDMLRVPIDVSTRRWEQQGWLRRSLANRALAVGYQLGVSPGTLAKFYRPISSTRHQDTQC
jgi:rSAM/selenodomain-associated transferase 2